MQGVARLLTDGGFEVVATAGTPTSCARRSPTARLVVADVQMPPGREDDGLRAALSCAGSGPRSACSCSRSTTRSGMRWT
jgi:DNA-binding NarL/FixJ family response regulator